MTYPGTAVEPRHSSVVACRPGAVVGRQVARRVARSGAVWGVVFALFVIVQTHAYTATYPTQAARNQLLSAYGTNLGLNALLGRAGAINTVAGFAAWRFLGILGAFGVLWGLLASTRLMRGEEDAGRYELLLTGATTRRRAAAQCLAGLGAGWCALFVVTAIGVVVTGRAGSVGFTVGQSLYFAVTLVSGAARGAE
jgi:ABC-2 type transport system permease protein